MRVMKGVERRLGGMPKKRENGMHPIATSSNCLCKPGAVMVHFHAFRRFTYHIT